MVGGEPKGDAGDARSRGGLWLLLPVAHCTKVMLPILVASSAALSVLLSPPPELLAGSGRHGTFVGEPPSSGVVSMSALRLSSSAG